MDSIQENCKAEVRFGIDGFSFSKLIVSGRKVPILVLNGKLVVFPSRYILFIIENQNVRFSKAKKSLKVLARFVDYLSRKNPSELLTPDALLTSTDILSIEEFLKSERGAVRESNKLLLTGFFTWLAQEEGVTIESLNLLYHRHSTQKA